MQNKCVEIKIYICFREKKSKKHKFWISFEKFYAGRWFKYEKVIENLSNHFKKENIFLA